MGPRVKKARSAKTKESSVVAEKEIIKEEDETNGSTEQVDKTAVDHGEELPPLGKGRARQKKTVAPLKDIKEETEVDVNGQTETKEEIPVQAKKARGRKKKANEDESEEVIPKRKDRTVKKNETPKETEKATEEVKEKPLEEEPKEEKAKREKRVPVKKGGKKKKDQDDEEKLTDEEMSVEAADDQASKDRDDDEEEKNADEDGGGDAKTSKKGKGKAAAKTSAVPPTKKKAAPRGKKGQLSKTDNELKEETDVEVDGKRLRVAIEHWELVSYLHKEYPSLEVSYNASPPRRNSFEFVLRKEDGSDILLWSGIEKGPPRKEKFPEVEVLMQAFKNAM